MFLVLHQTEYQIFTFIAGEGSLGKVKVTLVILNIPLGLFPSFL